MLLLEETSYEWSLPLLKQQIIISKVPFCEPIKTFSNEVTDKVCSILQAEVRDYRFHETRLEVTGVNQEEFNRFVTQIDGINIVNDGLCACDCHWSIVRLIDEEL